jgi:hypothetical protein
MIGAHPLRRADRRRAFPRKFRGAP